MKNIVNAVNAYLNNTDAQGLVPTSIQNLDDTFFAIHQDDNHAKWLVVLGSEDVTQKFETVETTNLDGKILVKAPLSDHNCDVMSSYFTWMKPVKRTGHAYSFGLGDRLGIASNAHLKLFKGRGVLPVLAQQSIRELNLTGRTYTDVINAASWSVFEEGYMDGFGADGDHLKNPFEIDYAIKCGFPMITLDCSEHIRNEVGEFDEATLKAEYAKVNETLRTNFENEYLNKTFAVSDDVSVTFNEKNLMESVLIFNDAILFAIEMNDKFVVPHDLDFEISIDETIVPTTPENHYFIANELKKHDIVVETMAPKFCGEFQKAIDYRGDLDQFREEYIVHEAIAKHFGYRLSIHSGSDKFAVYPTIGEISKEGWHVKTAGTNWLEALRVVAKNDKAFMLELYKFAMDHLNVAKAYYQIDATTDNALQLKDLNIDNIHTTLDDDMSRQVLHVTFGLILTHEVNGVKVLKERIYEILTQHYDDYDYFLEKHIGKHISLLNK